jgi:hypothetical protein
LETTTKLPRWAWPCIALGVIGLALLGPGWVASLRATHGSVATYTEILAAANGGDLEGVRRLCSRRYCESHAIKAAKEGGVVGLPRNIHKNFQVWREGPVVLLCPTDRVGPVYQFVYEEGRWKFDGPVGVLRGRGPIERLDESIAGESPEADKP